MFTIVILVIFVVFCLYMARKRYKLQKQINSKDNRRIVLAHDSDIDVYEQLKDLILSKADVSHAEIYVNKLSPNKKEATVKSAILSALDTFMADNYLDDEEAKIVKDYCGLGGFPVECLDEYPEWQRALRSQVVKRVMDGDIDKINIEIRGSLPIIMKKDERILWVFLQVKCSELKKRSIHYGTSTHHRSKGSYLGYSNFISMKKEYNDWVSRGTGTFIVTDKNLYFVSNEGNMRVSYDKLLSIDPYSDGLIIQKDTSSAKPIMFRNVDGVFVYNIANNL